MTGQVARNLGIESRGTQWILRDHAPKCLLRRRRSKRRPPSQRFIQKRAERIDVDGNSLCGGLARLVLRERD